MVVLLMKETNTYCVLLSVCAFLLAEIHIDYHSLTTIHFLLSLPAHIVMATGYALVVFLDACSPYLRIATGRYVMIFGLLCLIFLAVRDRVYPTQKGYAVLVEYGKFKWSNIDTMAASSSLMVLLFMEGVWRLW